MVIRRSEGWIVDHLSRRWQRIRMIWWLIVVKGLVDVALFGIVWNGINWLWIRIYIWVVFSYRLPKDVIFEWLASPRLRCLMTSIDGGCFGSEGFVRMEVLNFEICSLYDRNVINVWRIALFKNPSNYSVLPLQSIQSQLICWVIKTKEWWKTWITKACLSACEG